MITREVAEKLAKAKEEGRGPTARSVAYRRDEDGRYQLVEAISAESAGGAAAPEKQLAKDRRRVAILAIHGIGEQVRFETMERVALGLCRLEKQDPPQPGAADVAFEDFRTQRLEVTLSDPKGGPFDAHIYEGYWAPLTEGQVSLRDVFWFLLRGSSRAIPTIGKPFYRWMFKSPVEFHTGKGPFVLAFTTVLLLELAAFNVLIPLIVAARLGLPTPQLDLPRAFLEHFTRALDVVLLLAIVLFALLRGALRLKGKLPIERALGRGVRIAIGITIGLTLAAFFLLPACAWMYWRNAARLPELGALFSGMGITVTWVLLLLITAIARYFFIHYIGDIAAYISPQNLDRFTELRKSIQDSVVTVAQAMMSSQVKGEWEYDRVAIVGHSLGSVIAYDVVNRLFSEDLTGLAHRKAQDRIRLLLTFGSPLDKTAFVYGLHGHATSYPRELLAAKVQPLIDDYKYRERLTWRNIYSACDVLSGYLSFYDDKDNSAFPRLRVQNEVDPEAVVPLAAHEEYWSDKLLWERLREGLRG